MSNTTLPDPVTAVLAGYRPRVLSPAQWQLAAPAVREAVARCRPSSKQRAADLVSAVAVFLAGPCGWDRVTVPDLTALLTAANIERHVASLPAQMSHGARSVKRQRLRALAAGGAVGRLPLREPSVHRRSALVRALAVEPVSVTAIDAMWRARFGHTLSDFAVRDARLFEPRATAAARGRVASTVTPPATIRLLAAAPDQGTAQMTASTRPLRAPLVPTPTEPVKAAKPLSRRAALRVARAAMARLEGATLAPDPDRAEFDPQILKVADTYRLRAATDAQWEAIAPLVTRLILGYRPPSVGTARSVATHTATFLLWFYSWPGREEPGTPVRAVELLADGVVETYLRTRANPAASLATIRSVLRRSVASLDPAGAPARLPYEPLLAPYTPIECARIVDLARHQPTDARRRGLSFIVGLGLGAGLDGRDLRHVTARDIQLAARSDLRCSVRVTGGVRGARVIPIRAQYVPLVREALALHTSTGRADNDPVLGRPGPTPGGTYEAISKAVTANQEMKVAIVPARLRSTWLVALMCAPISLSAVMTVAGIRTARSLTDLLPYCPPADVDQVALAVAIADRHEGVSA